MTRKTAPRESRLFGRLSYFLISLLVAMLASRLDAQGPLTTQVTDIVYRSDGTPASGTVLISWPNFTTADQKAVAAGRMSVTLGTGGALSVALVPNAGGDPAGTYYKVVYQLDDGTNSEEYWSVPATGPRTIAAIRSKVVPSGVAIQVVSRQYVDDQLALKATDANLVHRTGAENVDGVKTFSSSPAVPAPAAASDATNKSYVDTQLALKATDANVVHQTGAENIAGVKTFGSSPVVPTPAASLDAANKAYVDSHSGGGGGRRTGDAINAIDDCGAIGDNVTDDYTALQNCLTNNAGKYIFLPKTKAYISDGGTATNCDYYSSQKLVMNGNTQRIGGVMPANWAGGTCIRFASGVGGIQAPFDAYSVLIENLELRGGDCAINTQLTTFEDWRGTETALLTGNGADGISIPGSVPRLQNVNVACFKRHGIYIAGDNTIHANSFPDFWYFDRVLVNSNRGDGIFINGGDSNAGVATMIDARANQLYGIRDNAGLGNTFIGVGTHANHNDAIVAGTTQALTGCSVISNVMTCTTSAALANGVDTVGTWVTTAGQSDSSYNTTCKVLTVNTGPKQITCNLAHANGSTTSGTMGTSSSASVYNAWSAAGIKGGCIGGADGAATWIQPYIESSQGIGGFCEGIHSGSTIIGSNNSPDAAGDLASAQPLWIQNAKMWTDSFTFQGPRDTTLAVNLIAGKTADQEENISFYNRSLSVRQQLKWVPDLLGFSDGVDGFFWLFKNTGGDSAIRGTSATEDIKFNQSIGRNVLFYGGGGTANVTMSSSGLSTTSQMASTLATGTAPFSITSTTPVANLALAADTQLPTIASAGKVSDSALPMSMAGKTFTSPITSSVATGTAPFAITSTTPVANLALAADTQLPTITTAGKVSDSALSSNIERKTNKNAASGYAGLDASSKLTASQLPSPAATALGGVQSKTCTGTDKLSAIGTDGVPVCTADQNSAGSGDSITVNAVAATDANLSDTTPAAPGGSVNVRWQKDAATPNNLSANLPLGYGLASPSSNLVVSLTTCEAYRSADLTLTANTYADNVSCSLGAGIWLITSETTVKSPVTTAQKVTVKLWDGTTVYTSSEAAAPSQGSTLTGYVSVSLSKIVTLASTTTVKTTVASTAASILDATPDDNGSGLGTTANAIHAVRIGN